MERFSAIINVVREKSGVWVGRTLAITALFILFFIAGGGISHNAKWRISQINVIGNSAVSSDEIRSLVNQKLVGNYFFVYARENSYLFPSLEIEQTLLDAFPRLASISVNRIDEHTIVVNVSERTPYALWCGDEPSAEGNQRENCWFINAAGFVFDRAPLFSKGVYVEVYGRLTAKTEGQVLRGTVSAERYRTIDTFTKLLREDIGKSFRTIITDDGEMKVSIQNSEMYPFLEGVTIRFKDEAIPAALVKNLLAALPVQFSENVSSKKKLLYIDMRFGNKVIFGFEQ